MNDTLELCEVGCVRCGMTGHLDFPERDSDGLFTDQWELRDCPDCDGTGKVTVHQWKRIGATSDGRSLKECERCGEVEECG